jgi:flavodoxin
MGSGGNMKTLVVYYSRTNTTKKVGDKIAEMLESDVEVLDDIKKRSGALGYIKCGREATIKELPKINKPKLDPSKYDLVIIGTPIWAWTMSSLIRTYITNMKDKFSNVAYFCTMGGSGDKKAFSHMSEIIGKNPKATLTLLTKEVVKENYIEKVEQFVDKVSN